MTTFESQWHRRTRQLFRGAEDDPNAIYRNAPEAFFSNRLRVRYITPKMSEMLHAMLHHEMVIVKSATGTGKSYTLAGAAIWLYKSYKRAGIYTAAASPIDNLRNILWGEIGTFVAHVPELFADDKINDLTIRRAKKEYITGVTIPSRGREADMVTAFSGKHHPDCVAGLFDEGDGVPDPCFTAFEGCLSGGKKRLAVICLNPKKREGYAYSQIIQGRAKVITMDAYSHPNVVSGEDLIPGAVNQPVVVRRLNEWCEPLSPLEEPDENCFVLPAFLDGLIGHSTSGKEYRPLVPGYYRATDDQYWYKIAGEYPPMGMNRLVSETKMMEAVARWQRYMDLNHGPPEDVVPDMGFDVADTEDDNALCFRYGSFVDTFVIWSGFDPPYSAKKASEYYHSRGCRQVFVDSIGVGAAIPSLMTGDGKCKHVIAVKVNEDAPGYSIDGEFDSMRDYAYVQLANWINNDITAMLPDDERLLASLRVLKRVPGPNDRIRVTQKKDMRSLLGFSPDAMEALMLTFIPKAFDSGSFPGANVPNRVSREQIEKELRLRRLLQGVRN